MSEAETAAMAALPALAGDGASALDAAADVLARHAVPAREGQGLLLGPLAGVLGYHVAQAAVRTGALFERHIGRPHGLRKVEFSMLMLLVANGPLSPKRLAQALALSAPNLSLILDRLQARGLVQRQRNALDRRSQNIVLTDEGTGLAAASAADAEPMERVLHDRLSRAEHAMLIELLRKVSPH